ncbi:MAG TPA: hypothetical protein VMX95_02295 [Thermodesulfobacteriota bacterium]|nr:hypothetical protein [Thermodesulfobacteriota bacterium]
MVDHGEQIFFKSETLPTFTERGFQPILETFCKELDTLELQPIDTIEGKSIKLLRDGIERPFLKGYFKTYQTDKCEKITICNCILMERILTSAVIAIPNDDYELPMLVLEWSETESVISVVVDYIPLVDLVMREDYRVKYLDPLDQYWTKYKELPGMAPNRFAWSRMLFSPYYHSGHIPKQDEKNIKASLELMQNYLELWIDLCKKAEPITDDTHKEHVKARKARIRKIFRDNDEGAKSLLQMVGKEIIDILLLCSF